MNGRAPVTLGSIIHRAKVGDREGYIAWKTTQMVGREREWATDPAQQSRVHVGIGRVHQKVGHHVSLAKLFRAMFPKVYGWSGEGRCVTPFFHFDGCTGGDTSHTRCS